MSEVLVIADYNDNGATSRKCYVYCVLNGGSDDKKNMGQGYGRTY